MNRFGSERIWKRKDLEVNRFGSERIWKRTDLEAKGFGSEQIWKRKDLEAKGFRSERIWKCKNLEERIIKARNVHMRGNTCATMMAHVNLLLLLFDVRLSALPSLPVGSSLTDIILAYFCDGYQYETILAWLCLWHRISISLSKLKRILRRLGLKRRQRPTLEHFHLVEALMRLSLSNLYDA